MRRAVISPALLAVVFVLLAVPAQAQSRVFVAAHGSDTNPCTFAAPCRSFQHAHDVMAANGEIDVLDPAGYGSLTITKAISIQGHGFSGITALSGNAITVNAGATDTVGLFGLIVEGGGAGQNGIVFKTGLKLTVEKCVIRNMTGGGIVFQPNNNVVGSITTQLAVSDTYVANNGQDGVQVFATDPNTVVALFNRVEAYFNGSNGIDLRSDHPSAPGTINSTISDSVAGGNGLAGFSAPTNIFSPGTAVMIVRSNFSRNGTGLNMGEFATVAISQTTVAFNFTAGWTNSGGNLDSFGNNYFFLNGSNTGSLTPITAQ